MIYLLLIFLESICMLLWLHIGFKRKIEESSGKAIFLVVYVVYYYFVTMFEADLWSDALSIIFILIWSIIKFKEKINSAILKYVVSILCMNLSQMLSMHIILLVDDKIIRIGLEKRYIGMGILCAIIAICVYSLTKKKRHEMFGFNKFTIPMLLYIMGIVLFIKYDYEKNNHGYTSLYILLILLLLAFVIVIVRDLKINHRLEQKQLELELREKYEETYAMLLEEMRRKQHDYNNQVSALYSIQLIEGDKTEITKIQKEYCEQLLKLGEYDDLILNCDNPVLSGYIYTRCNEALRLGIKIQPRISCTNKDYNIALHEIIEILGILINNSVEYLNSTIWERKEIKLNIYEDKEKIHIEVANIAEYQSYENLEKMFSNGYSTKGCGRGIGLPSLKSIVEKNKGKLFVGNEQKMDVNWFKINVVI